MSARRGSGCARQASCNWPACTIRLPVANDGALRSGISVAGLRDAVAPGTGVFGTDVFSRCPHAPVSVTGKPARYTSSRVAEASRGARSC